MSPRPRAWARPGSRALSWRGLGRVAGPPCPLGAAVRSLLRYRGRLGRKFDRPVRPLFLFGEESRDLGGEDEEVQGVFCINRVVVWGAWLGRRAVRPWALAARAWASAVSAAGRMAQCLMEIRFSF